jgi:ribonuclease HI
MIVHRLSWFLEKNKLIKPSQAGFRKMCSTSDPVIRLKQEAEFALNSGNITVAILIDFTRAFDLLWVDGLILKLMQLKISGNMLKWIQNFLTNRQYQVNIGNEMSFTYETENGTPQGSAISPLLFLIMVNDFPKLSQFTSDAFFADDCTIWRTGNNLAQIIYHLQNDLDLIGEWCKEWGFTLNTEKTTGIIFSRKKECNNRINLKIQGKTIIFKNSCKLLGVTFDNHLTWNPHTDELVDKSKKSLNILRCVSGTTWGAGKSVLLTLYKALILSQIDYCCFVYLNSAKSVSKRLDTIQYKALMLCTGGMKGTSLNALLGECDELPLWIRRKKILLKYLLKINNLTRNSAHYVLLDKYYYQLGLRERPYYKELLNNFLLETEIELDSGELTFNSTPWLNFCDQVDLSLLSFPLLIKSDIELSNFFINLTETYKYLIFCDGSVKPDGKVGAAITSTLFPSPLLFKLPNHFTIYYAEGYALLKAILYVINHNLDEVCIISDSSKVLQDIKSSALDHCPHPFLISQICRLINDHPHIRLVLKWFPGHCNNVHIQNTDKNAKLASTFGSSAVDIKYTRNESVQAVDDWISKLWQKEWSQRSTSSYQKIFTSSKNCHFFQLQRRQETIISRLRLQQSNLNSGLHKLGLHDDGSCSTCGKLQDSYHFLIECPDNEQLRLKLKNSRQAARDWNLSSLLSDPASVVIIANYVTEKKLTI